MKNSPLIWRGLLLVFVPLACEVLLVVVLLFQLDVVNKEVIANSRQRTLVEQSYELCVQLIDTLLTTDLDGVGRLKSESTFDEARAGLEKKYTTLVESLKIEKNKVKELEKLNQAHASLENFFKWIESFQKRGRKFWFNTNDNFDVVAVKCGEQFLDASSGLMFSAERELLGGNTDKQLALAESITITATALGAAIGVFLGLGYAVTIKRPLDRISENCLRMTKQEPLSEPLSGDDELSRLDRLIHEFKLAYDEALDKEKAMLENASDLICSLDSQGRFVRVNKHSLALLGYEPEELVGTSILDLCPAQEAAMIDEKMRQLTGGATITFDLELRTRSNSIVETRWSCIWSDSEKELFAVAHDVSEAKNVERLKQDFVDMISHDLRSPLTSILVGLTMIADGIKGPVPEQARVEIDSSLKNVSRLIDFINDLLDFQKINAGKMELELAPCQLKAICEDAFEMVKASAEAKRLTVHIQHKENTIFGDQQKLTQVFVNLLANAIRFSPDNQTIVVDFLSSKESVEVRVTDRGPGVPLELRETIFDAFQQAPPMDGIAQTGTGLGLAICKLIVEAHGGKICVVDSVEQIGGNGSTFRVRLPRQQLSADRNDQNTAC